MATQGSKRVIYAALIGNSLIAVTKFGASIFTGSSAMFSEAIHSTVDTGNQALLLYGIRRAKRSADDKHPFGYSQEIYFWAFVVAILIFAVGAGISLYEGVHKVMHPEPVHNAFVNYLVLGFAMIFEGFAWHIAFREFNSRRGRRTYLQAFQEAKDPSVVTVLLEDSAAMLGLIAAFLGIVAAQVFQIPEFDGVASIVIGLILAGTAMLLAYETKSMLIGEAAAPEVVAHIEQMLREEDGVAGINEILTMHMGPRDILVNLSVDFVDNLSAGEVEQATARLESVLKADHPEIKRVFVEVQSKEDHDAMVVEDD